jgi:hypothetical protein
MSCVAAFASTAAAAHAHRAAASSSSPPTAAAHFQQNATRRRLPHQQSNKSSSSSSSRHSSHLTRVVKKGPEPGELSEDEAQYRAMMKQTKEWMAYDPDELPESHPAPWETHIQKLMDEGPW